MSNCNHRDIDLNVIIKQYDDELVSGMAGPIVLWLGDITCKTCGQALHISSDAILDNESGALGFQLKTSTMKMKSMTEAPPIDRLHDVAIVEVQDFEFA